jgi:choline dehydrogenase-like flavoprotein
MSNPEIDSIIATPPEALRAEIAVVGSGPGGAITACLLAEAGRDVLLLEEGPFLQLGSRPNFSKDDMTRKYRNGGITMAVSRTKIAYVEGRCVGGGSEINSGLYHRTPPDILEEWQREYSVDALTEADLLPHFEACERDLTVSYLPGVAPGSSLKLHEGARKLGWKSQEVPRWFRYHEVEGDGNGSGDHQSMTKTYIPRALRAGCRLLADTRVVSLKRRLGGWSLKAAYSPDAGSRRHLQIQADRVFICGGAIQTPSLLRRSGIKTNIGDALKLHPTTKVIARFDERINALEMGVPVHQIREFSPNLSLGGSIASPAYLALGMVDHPGRLGDVDNDWEKMAVYYAMSRAGRGRVRSIPFYRDAFVSYRLEDNELHALSDGLHTLCRVLLSAGAKELYPSINGHPRITRESDLSLIPRPLQANRTNLMTIHLFSSCPMGENRKVCATDSFGRVHGQENLFIADASLLCGAPGVNPQGSIMAIARRNALRFVGKL